VSVSQKNMQYPQNVTNLISVRKTSDTFSKFFRYIFIFAVKRRFPFKPLPVAKILNFF
jgi:hypothetical protein